MPNLTLDGLVATSAEILEIKELLGIGSSSSRQIADIRDFSVTGSADNDDTSSILRALTQTKNKGLFFPSGVYNVSASLAPQLGCRISGEGRYNTLFVGIGSAANHVFDLSNDQIALTDIGIDGGKAQRGTGGGNNVYIHSSGNELIRVNSNNSPNAGVLVDGQTSGAALNSTRDCRFEDNAGVGYSQSGTTNNSIIGSFFARSGLENLTIDGHSHACTVVANRFFRHLGGCGNVGWDASDNSIFACNFLDGENSTGAAVGNRNGVCVNAQTGATLRSLIANNTILNFLEYGIYCRDRTGQTPGFRAGSAVVEANTFAGNGLADIRIGETDQTIYVRNNLYSDDSGTRLVIDDTSPANVHASAGEVYWDVSLAQNQLFNASTDFQTVLWTQTTLAHGAIVNGGTVTVAIPGLYQLNVKLRLGNLVAAGVSEISFLVNTPNGSKVINEPAKLDNQEIGMSFIMSMQKGPMNVQVRTFGTNNAQINVQTGIETFFQGTLVG